MLLDTVCAQTRAFTQNHKLSPAILESSAAANARYPLPRPLTQERPKTKGNFAYDVKFRCGENRMCSFVSRGDLAKYLSGRQVF